MRRDFFTGGNRENRGEMGEERDGGRFEQKVAKSAKVFKRQKRQF
jgi:hypothetical protein